MFFTPSQRASLDVARKQRARTTVATEATEEVAATAAPVPQTITFDGMVRRSDGKTTVWINNRPVNENEQAGGVVFGRIRPDGGISLQVPQTGRSVELKVGQSIELLSGQIEDAYTRKPPAAAPEPKPAAKPSAQAKPAAAPASAERAAAERDREDQQRKLEESVRALQDAAAKSGTASAAPPQEPSR